MNCPKCGTSLPNGMLQCPSCGTRFAPQPAPAYRQPVSPYGYPPKKSGSKWWIIPCCIVGAVVLFFSLCVALSFLSDGISESETAQTRQESEDDYKDSCAQVDYKELLRNPTSHEGERVWFRGKVAQIVSETDDELVLRIYVTESGYGIWDDDIYVTFEREDTGENRILEDDIVTVYGESDGTETYRTVLLAARTVPRIEAEYIDLEDNTGE